MKDVTYANRFFVLDSSFTALTSVSESPIFNFEAVQNALDVKSVMLNSVVIRGCTFTRNAGRQVKQGLLFNDLSTLTTPNFTVSVEDSEFHQNFGHCK